MSEKILVPVLGESITEATVSKWLKNKGETVDADEPIVELETDKVNLEVPSPVTGKLIEINCKDGSTVKVGEILGSVTEIQGQIKKFGVPISGNKEEVIDHLAFSLSYNEYHEQANWVMHIILPAISGGNATRSNDFREDTLVATGTSLEQDYFLKENEINNINKINKKIKENILSNRNFFIIGNEEIKSLIFIEKKFETLEGIIADLYSVRSQDELDDNFLRCKNLISIKDNQNIIHKEYKLVDLNDSLKKNLININDYVKFLSDDQNIYIVLCNIKFDKEILNNVDLNKQINLNAIKIEKEFINKYSKIYNLIKFDE